MRLLCASLLFASLGLSAAEDPASAMARWHEALAAGDPPPVGEVLADVGGARPQQASLSSMSSSIISREWDFRIVGHHQDDTMAVVVVEIVREKGTDSTRRTAFYAVQRNGWRWLLSNPHDAALTGLSAQEHAAVARLDAWMAEYRHSGKGLTLWIPPAVPVVSTAAKAATSTPAPIAAPQASTANGAEEEDEADPYLKAKVTVHAWTEIQRRSNLNTLLPSATPIKAGDFSYRIIHVAQEAYYANLKSNLLGLDDNVKIGIGLGYGITDACDIWLQRSNGHDLQVGLDAKEPTQMDYYDLLGRYRILDQAGGRWPGIADVAVVGGVTAMIRNQSNFDTSLNYGLIVERTLLFDRVRLGSGIFHAGLSAYERTLGLGPDYKPFPDEYPQLPAGSDVPAKGTTAIPLNLKLALDHRWQLFGEAVFPISGYRTSVSPTIATGFRFNTNTHEFSFYVTNSANTAFNGVITGGATELLNLPLFGFSITAFL